jgi:hypothetical protein
LAASTGLSLFPAIAVVGERTVDAAAGVRIDGYPLRAIHFRRPHHVSRQAGFNQQIALVFKTVAFIQAILPEDQRQPVAAPSSLNLATYSVPEVSSCILASRFAGSYFLSETNL